MSLEHVNDDLGQQIGKIRYHYFKNWDFQKKLKLKSVYFFNLSYRILIKFFFENNDILFYLFVALNHH